MNTSSSPFATPDLGTRQKSKFSAPSTPAIQAHNKLTTQLPTPSSPYNDESPISPTSPVLLKIEHSGKNLQDELILSDLMIPSDVEIQLVDQIGSGSTCKVYNCKLQSFDKNVVIKIPSNIKKNHIMKREAVILHKLQSPFISSSTHIISSFGLYNYNDRLCIVLEKMDMDLDSYLNSLPVIQDITVGRPQLMKLFHCLTESLALMKKLNIVHCDLKTSNILINPQTHVFKICDFSSSKYSTEASLDTDTTLQFLAPELLQIPNKSNHNFATDLYSAGLILLHATTGKQPYNDFINGNLFHLINLIKKNSVLRVLDTNSIEILTKNNDVCEMLTKIIIQRCDLAELLLE